MIPLRCRSGRDNSRASIVLEVWYCDRLGHKSTFSPKGQGLEATKVRALIHENYEDNPRAS